MGLFKRAPIECNAGEWTRIIFDFGKGFPETMNVELDVHYGTEIFAEFRETHYNWIFPKEPVTA